MFKKNQQIFGSITWANAAIGILLLIWQWKAIQIPYSFQIGYFFAMIGITGIPHGALDHVIAKNNGENKNKFSIQQFIKRYVLAIIAYSICWIFFPSACLLIFLLISAWHFGETDLADVASKTHWDNFGRMICGIFILMIILLTHQNETAAVIERITKGQQEAMMIWTYFANNSLIALIIAGVALLTYLMYAISKKKLTLNYWPYANLVIILVLCSQLPLLISFALYFGGWHAIRSFKITYSFLHHQRDEHAADPLTMWKNALPMSFLAAFGFIFMAYIWTGLGIKSDPIPALFIFLSMITLPHLDVMDKLIRSDKN